MNDFAQRCVRAGLRPPFQVDPRNPRLVLDADGHSFAMPLITGSTSLDRDRAALIVEALNATAGAEADAGKAAA